MLRGLLGNLLHQKTKHKALFMKSRKIICKISNTVPARRLPGPHPMRNMMVASWVRIKIEVCSRKKKKKIIVTMLKGKFPQTSIWIGWVESNFENPTVKVWADLDNPFKRSDYAKLCMSPSLDGTLPEYVISQGDNSPLTLYIDFQNFSFFLDINNPFDQVHSYMHAHSSQA